MKSIDISILILTHNRPELFTRCLKSVISAYNESNNKYHIEILVNNDSCDIHEICEDYITYYYYHNNNLGKIYKNLFDKATGKFIYYLEDDDYITKDFFNHINLEHDWNFLNFKLYEIKEAILEAKKEFKIPVTNTHFQLSQLLFKKNLIKEFPVNNKLDNDWKLLNQLRPYKCYLVKNYMFIQTKDNNDNISDINKNKDKRWPMLNNTE